MTALRTAQEHWGAGLPDWVERLAQECEASSQNKVAQKLKISAGAISQTLRKKYAGNMQNIEEVVRGVFMEGTVDCPALGTVEGHVCYDWRQKSRVFTATNFRRSQMYRACNACPRNGKEG